MSEVPLEYTIYRLPREVIENVYEENRVTFRRWCNWSVPRERIPRYLRHIATHVTIYTVIVILFATTPSFSAAFLLAMWIDFIMYREYTHERIHFILEHLESADGNTDSR